MCYFMPNLPDTTKHSYRRGGRCYGDEWGEKGKKFGGTGERERIKNRKHIIKNVRFKLFTQKNTKLHCFAKKFEDIYCKYLHEQ